GWILLILSFGAAVACGLLAAEWGRAAGIETRGRFTIPGVAGLLGATAFFFAFKTRLGLVGPCGRGVMRPATWGRDQWASATECPSCTRRVSRNGSEAG